jgi:hypothetical protein
LEVEALARRRRPQARHDRELLLEPVEALAGVGEGDAVGAVLLLEPSRAEAELDPAAGHRVDRGHRDRQRSREAEGGGRDQRAEADALCVPGQTRQRHPRLGGSRLARPRPHAQEVVGAEERIEVEALRLTGDGQQVVVRRSLLGLCEDA